MTTLAFELPGDWTSAWIFVRLLMVGQSPWEPDEHGFLVHRASGERVHLEMFPPAGGLASVFAEGLCPIRPTVDDALLDEIARHQSVIRLSLDPGITGTHGALTLLRAADAVVDAGALAVRCATSGLVHAADSVGPLRARAEAVADAPDAAVAEALYESYVLIRTEGSPRTLGMHALGAPDVVLRDRVEHELAAVRLEDAARALLREGPTGRKAHADALSKADPRHNPLGCVLV